MLGRFYETPVGKVVYDEHGLSWHTSEDTTIGTDTGMMGMFEPGFVMVATTIPWCLV